MRNLLRMLRFVTPYKWRLFVFAFTCVGFSLLSTLPLVLVHEFLGAVLETKDEEQFWVTLGLLMACWLMRAYFLVRRSVAGRYVASAVVRDATNRVMAHIVRQPLSFFDKWRSGELMSRINSDAAALGQTVSLLTILLREPLTVAGMLIVLARINWKLTLLGIVGFPVAAWPIAVLGRRIRRASHRTRESGADRADAMVQSLGGIRVVKGFGREGVEGDRFCRTNSAIFDHTMKGVRAGALLQGAVEMVNGVGIVAVVAVGGYLAIKAHAGFRVQDFMTFLLALGALHHPSRALGTAVNQVNSCLPGAERLFELLDVEESLPVAKDAVRVGASPGAIRFRKVSFSYGREEVLRSVDLEIEPGRVTAIVGPSGSGKSTALNLIARFYDPVEGAVEVAERDGGVDLRRVEPSSWLDRLGLVTQDPLLFNCSILDNIRYGRLDATDEEVHEAARIADIHEDIMKLPEGYATPAGERGAKLSGGQRQRVCLARALVRDPAVLLLDEATSSLDSASEKIVQEAIERAQAGRTSVVVAHRLSTIMHADRIYVLVGGEIEASGRHEELIEKSPTYGRLWRIQQGERVE